MGDNPKLSECDLYYFPNLASKSRISSAVVIIITLSTVQHFEYSILFSEHTLSQTPLDFLPVTVIPSYVAIEITTFMPKIEET